VPNDAEAFLNNPLVSPPAGNVILRIALSTLPVCDKLLRAPLNLPAILLDAGKTPTDLAALASVAILAPILFVSNNDGIRTPG
jgi:hypothetical protein